MENLIFQFHMDPRPTKRRTCAAEEKDGARDQNQLQEDGAYQHSGGEPQQIGS